MRQVVVFSESGDLHVQAVLSHLPTDVLFQVITVEDLISKGYTVQLDASGSLSIECLSGSITISEKDADLYTVWFRKPNYFFYHSQENHPFENEYQTEEVRAFLDTVFIIFTKSKWLNHIQAIRKANNRILQLQAAAEVGLNIPSFVITNDMSKARVFYDLHKDVVIKRLGNRRIQLPTGMSIYTSRISAEDLVSQEFSGGVNYLQQAITYPYEIRVTIIKNDVFACLFERDLTDPSVIDYRAQERPIKYEVHALPNEILDKLKILVRRFDLNYAAVDLLMDSRGNYIFLEMNPNGEYLWIEEATGLPISASMAQYLIL